jgi:hypothetical protein
MIRRSLWIVRDLNRLRRFLVETLDHISRVPLQESDRPDSDALEEAAALQQIALRAVYYELAAIVEHEVQRVLVSITRGHGFPSHQRRDLPWEMDRSEARRLVEQACGITLRDLPGSATVERIQKIADSLKHRRGLKSDYRGDKPAHFPEYYDLDLGQARNAIAEVETFLVALGSCAEL